MLPKDDELNIKNYLAIVKTISQREKSIYLLPIYLRGKKKPEKKKKAVLYLYGYASIQQQI